MVFATFGRYFRRNSKLAAAELNLLATSSLSLLSLYAAFAAIFGQPFFAPFSQRHQTNTNTSSVPEGAANHTHQQQEGVELYNANFFSIFLLWTLALCAGRIFHYIKLPPLLGMLLMGMAFANIRPLNALLIMRPAWNGLLRSTAFVLILLRSGIGLNPDVLRKSLLFCSALGILTTCAEIVAITLISHFLFALPMPAAILFGFVLASTSPAVTVPTMLQLQQCHRGTCKGIPTMTLASASIDNIFCISAFSIAFSIASANSGQFIFAIVLVPLQLIAAILLGFLFGFLLRFVPSPTADSLHFPRVLILFSLSMALYFGTKAIHFDVCGPIAVILTCFLAASGWKTDNPQGTHLEAEALRLMWNLLLLPLLFVLIGLLFDFSIFTWEMLAQAILIMAIGIGIRILATFFIAKANARLNTKEAVFFSIAFLPKATVQAALAPPLFAFSLANNNDVASAQFTLQTCILSILLTAPTGQLLIQQFGNRFLSLDQKRPSETGGQQQKEGKASGGKRRGRGGSAIAAISAPNSIDIVVGLPTIEEEEGEKEAMEEDIFSEKSPTKEQIFLERHSSI